MSAGIGPGAAAMVAPGTTIIGLAMVFGLEALTRRRYMARREAAYEAELATARAQLADPTWRKPVIMPRRWDIIN